MKRSRPAVLTGLVTAAVLMGTPTDRATAGLVVSFDSNSHVFSGTTPGGSAIWAEASFTRLGDHEVQVEFLIPTNSVSGLYLDDAGFQFNTGTTPSFTHESGVTASSASFNASGIAVTGTGNEKFNTNFNFPNSSNNRIEFGKDSIYDITFSSSSPVLAGDLSNLFKSPDASGNDFVAAAHLAGNNNKSSGISGPFISVPEPYSLVMLGTGFVGLALACGSRRHRRRMTVPRYAGR